MDHHEAPRDGGSTRRTPLRAERSRARVGRSNARVADAAKAAADGLRGVRRIDGARAEGSVRAPGVGVLFDPVLPVGAPPSSGPVRVPTSTQPGDAWPMEERAPGSTAADGGVWNPFRQQRRPAPRRPDARPEIGNLHLRHTAIGVKVIATLVHRGRQCHGTAVGPSSGQGRLRAVAEATVAALRIVVDEPLPVGVDRIGWVDDDPGRVEVVVTWATGSGAEALIGTASARDGADGAIMQATLHALSGRFEQLVRTAPPR